MQKVQRDRFQRWIGFQMGRIARQRALVGLLLAFLALAGRALLLHSIPVPKPGIQDEFSYLLAADTYASGRLTNPKHPMWMHFETVHVMVQPTYQSKYPPLQGLILAFGQAICGVPWMGVWLSMGLFSAAVWWALSGWLPPRWALLGGLLALLKIGMISYWSESYWGGFAAATAGALVIGSVPRLRTQPDWKNTVVFATGLALLANSRPYEGLILGVACMVAVLMKVRLGQVALPLASVLIPAVLWIFFYNYRVTGHPFLLPYRAHEQQYATWSPFIWDTHPHPAPHYNHESMRATWIGWEQAWRAKEREHPFAVRAGDLLTLDRFYLRIPLTLCILVFAVAMFRRQPKMRMALLLFLAFAAGLEMETFLWPHYAAPGTALVFILAAGALRRLRHFSPTLMRITLAIVILLDLIDLTIPSNRYFFDKRDFIARRDTVLQRLNAAQGKQLVLAEYGPGHDVNHEWVYNRADIDAARIVWAHAMGSQNDRELLDYFRDREVWKLIDNGPGGLELSRMKTGATGP